MPLTVIIFENRTKRDRILVDSRQNFRPRFQQYQIGQYFVKNKLCGGKTCIQFCPVNKTFINTLCHTSEYQNELYLITWTISLWIITECTNMVELYSDMRRIEQLKCKWSNINSWNIHHHSSASRWSNCFWCIKLTADRHQLQSLYTTHHTRINRHLSAANSLTWQTHGGINNYSCSAFSFTTKHNDG